VDRAVATDRNQEAAAALQRVSSDLNRMSSVLGEDDLVLELARA
jgi:hypothetical protein